MLTLRCSIQASAISQLVNEHATTASFKRALYLIYNPASTELTQLNRQFLAELALATAAQSATPGLMHGVTTEVGCH